MRYEIKDITPPENVREAMELQVAAERKKRAQILMSEGDKQSLINNAEAKKAEAILASEAEKMAKKEGIPGENLLILLEMRLDNVMFRLGYGRTRKESIF